MQLLHFQINTAILTASTIPSYPYKPHKVLAPSVYTYNYEVYKVN